MNIFWTFKSFVPLAGYFVRFHIDTEDSISAIRWAQHFMWNQFGQHSVSVWLANEPEDRTELVRMEIDSEGKLVMTGVGQHAHKVLKDIYERVLMEEPSESELEFTLNTALPADNEEWDINEYMESFSIVVRIGDLIMMRAIKLKTRMDAIRVGVQWALGRKT